MSTDVDPLRFIDAKVYTQADLDQARKEAREAAFREAIKITEDLTCAPQFEGNWRNGYSHAQNDAFRAIEAAAATDNDVPRLTEEESQLVVGSIPLQALPDNNDALTRAALAFADGQEMSEAELETLKGRLANALRAAQVEVNETKA